jgi:ABC-type oligopeptide transport system ATPase subunit
MIDVQVRLYTPNDGNVIINKKAFVNYLTGKVSKEYKEELRDFIKYEFPDFLNNFEEELHDSSYEPFPSNQDVINQLEEAFSYFCTSRPDEFYNLVKQEDEL